MTLSKEEAKKKAAKELRFNIGNMPHLGEAEYDEQKQAYIFPINYTHPELPETTGGDVEFYETQQIGEMTILENGEIQRTPNEKLRENISEVREKAKSGKIEKI